MAFYVYILECSDGSYYTGHTDDLEKRLETHNSGELDGYTKNRRPLTLVFLQEFPSRDEAFAAERQIKGWTRRKPSSRSHHHEKERGQSLGLATKLDRSTLRLTYGVDEKERETISVGPLVLSLVEV